MINVEYNQLDPLLRATGHPDGDVNSENGYSPFPGNINQVTSSALILFTRNVFNQYLVSLQKLCLIKMGISVSLHLTLSSQTLDSLLSCEPLYML